MTKRMNVSSSPIADILKDEHNYIAPINQGIDSIKLIAKYEIFKKMAEKMGLTFEPMPKSNKYWKKINNEVKIDTKKRLTADKFSPIIEVIKLPKVDPKDKDFYISIVRNVPTLFDVAKHNKKAKDSFCMVTFAGLHQPSKKISSDAMKIISKFLKRKAFKLNLVDIAIDTEDKRTINKEGLKAFSKQFKSFSSRGANLMGSSYYINTIDHIEDSSMSKIIFYDKYQKQLNQQKKEKIPSRLRAWKRLEVTLTFDVTKRENKGFIAYMESMAFMNDLCVIDEVSKKAKIKSYSTDYLIYQINSLLDNRFMNNHESKTQFNSVDALERFKSSDFRRYILAI
jgi:hypothetical protein